MKIVCDAEKIQGKAFKIRCKKCNHIIVVKVGADGAPVTAPAGAASAERARSTGSHAAVSGAAGAERARTTAPSGSPPESSRSST